MGKSNMGKICMRGLKKVGKGVKRNRGEKLGDQMGEKDKLK